MLPSVPCWTFLVAQAVKNLPANSGDQGLITGWERSPGEGNSYPLQYSCLKNPMDRGAWQAPVHGVAELYMTEQLTLCPSLVLPCLFPFCPSFPFSSPFLRSTPLFFISCSLRVSLINTPGLKECMSISLCLFPWQESLSRNLLLQKSDLLRPINLGQAWLHVYVCP